MSCFNDDRATFNEVAAALDTDLSQFPLDQTLQKAFDAGMNLDEIMYVLITHTERIVRRSIVQDQLKKVANKDK